MQICLHTHTWLHDVVLNSAQWQLYCYLFSACLCNYLISEPVNCLVKWFNCRSQGPRGLRRRSTAARRLRFWVRISPGAWMSACCERCVLSGSGLCDTLFTRPEESYRLWYVCYLETSRMRRPWPALGCSATGGGGRWFNFLNTLAYIRLLASVFWINTRLTKWLSL